MEPPERPLEYALDLLVVHPFEDGNGHVAEQ
jgi:fido (protein-threonine AMPylation protein)